MSRAGHLSRLSMNFRNFDHFAMTDRVVVLDRFGRTQALQRDPMPIAEFLILLDNYADSWDVPVQGVPVVDRYYNFYAGTTPLGHVGIAEDVLVLHYAGNFWARAINQADQQRFLSALAGLA